MIVHTTTVIACAVGAALLFMGTALVLTVLAGPPSPDTMAVLAALWTYAGSWAAARIPGRLTRAVRACWDQN